MKSWLIFLHHFCTLTDYILLSCRSSKRNRIIFLICHRKNLTLRRQSYRINTLLSFSPLSLLFLDNIFEKITSEWVFYITMVELCRIKLLILSLPGGQSALMNKSAILFNITLKRYKGINTNLYQVHCSKKSQLVLKNLVLQLIIIHLYSILFLNCNICVLQNDLTCIGLEAACCLIDMAYSK